MLSHELSHPSVPAPAPAFHELLRDEIFRLETRRLWLRWPAASDAAALAEIGAVAARACGAPRWPLSWDGSADGVSGLIEQLRAANAAGTALHLALADKTRPDELIGLAGIDASAGGAATSLGFTLRVERQGYGLMTEAVRALMAAAFRFALIERVRGAAGLTGIGARRVLEKAGFTPVSARPGPAPACAAMEARRRPQRLTPARAATAGEIVDCPA